MGAESYVTATAADGSGNVYVAGNFTGALTLGGSTLTSAGSNDVFIAKWEAATARFVWAQRAGGTGDDQIRGLSVAGSSVYIVGDFTGSTFDFGPTTLHNMGELIKTDAFVAKLTDTGPAATYGWVKQIGGAGQEFGNAIALSGTSAYVVGWFDGASTHLGDLTLPNGGRLGYPDLFVAKVTDAGSTADITWAQRAGGTGDDVAAAVAVSGTSVYVAGHFDGPTASFGSTVLTNVGQTNVFVAKLTDAGSTSSFTWAQAAGGAGTTEARALAVNGPNLYLTGVLFSAEPNHFGTTTLISAGASDVFVAKLTDSGSMGVYTWALRAGGTGRDVGVSLAVQGPSVYVGGAYQSVATFGTTTLTSAGDFDVFVAKLTDSGSTGAVTWVQSAGGSGPDYAYAVGITGTSVYVAGSARPPAHFGALSLATPSGNQTGFLASLTDRPLLAAAPAHSLSDVELWPNPAHGAVTVVLPVGWAGATIALTDVLGRTVRTFAAGRRPLTDQHQLLSLAGLPAGLYAVRLQVGPVKAVRWLVID